MNELKVMIVDDDEDTADLLAFQVRTKGHYAFVAYNALSGLRLASEIIPDIIIHDLGLPDMPGLEALRLLRRDTASTTTLVAHTGVNTEEARASAQDVGCDHFVVKPMQAEFLLHLLKKR